MRLTGRGTRHRTTDHIAWRVALPDLDPWTEYEIRVTRNSDDKVVARIEDLTDGERVVYGRLEPLRRPGTYTVRLYLDGQLVERERLSIVVPPTPRPTARPTSRPRARGNCDPSYPTVCIRPYPPDLDCGDVPFRRFRVRGRDSHGFDGDNDGVGCESG